LKQFRLGLFPNSYKQGANDPDAKGTLAIPLSVINELYQGISMGTIKPKQGYGEGAEQIVELGAAAWKGDGSLTASGKQRPAISVVIDSPEESAQRAKARAEREATKAQPAAGAPSGWGAPALAAPAAAPSFNDSMPF